MGRAGEAPRCAPRLRRQSAALRERPAALSATILRVRASLDLDTVLAEGERFEQALQRLRAGLSKPRTTRRLQKVWQRTGRLKQKYPQASPHFQIEVRADDKGAEAVGLSSQHQAAEHSIATHPGVYCLRTNLEGWGTRQLWSTYVQLTDLEAVFRSLKSELGLRPIYLAI